jgi:PAS domain-containing protein
VRSFDRRVIYGWSHFSTCGLATRCSTCSKICFGKDNLRGVWEESDDPEFQAKRLMNIPLREDVSSLNTLVLRSGKPIIVKDAASDPRADQRLVQELKINCAAIVPLARRAGTPIGTVWIEPKEEVAPSTEEVDDLTQFAEQLTVAIQQAEQVSMLHRALDGQPTPITVIDGSHKIRFANEMAALHMGVSSGWQPSNDAQSIDTLRPAESRTTTYP